MNLLIIIALYTNVFIHVVISGKKETPQIVGDKDEWTHETHNTNSERMSEKRGSKGQTPKKKDTPYAVRAVIYKGRTVYKCNGQIFRTKKDAKQCLRKLKEKPKFPSHQRLTIPPYIPPSKPCRSPIPPPIPPRPANLPRRPNRRIQWSHFQNKLGGIFKKLHIR
uniref:Secreted protein n=1 Tax=Strongyloides venezuelensis TaxID=75913 RepID=A0A0K0G1Z5_STRVS